jgi:O-antigen ligase
MSDSAHQPQRKIQIACVIVAGVVCGTIAAIVGPAWTGILTAAAIVAAGIFVSPWVGVVAMLFVLPLERIGAYESSIGTIRMSQILGLIVLLSWMVRIRIRRNPPRMGSVLFPLGAFCLVAALGVLVAPNPSRSIAVLILVFFTCFIGYAVAHLVNTQQRLNRALLVVCASATLACLFGLFQFIGDTIGLPASLTGLRDLYSKDVLGFPRIQSTALEPLYFANYLLLPLGVLYAFLLSKKPPISRWLILLVFALTAANLVLTISRGGYLGFAALLCVMSIIAFKDVFRPLTIIPILIGAALVGTVVVRAIGSGGAPGMNWELFTGHVRNVFFGASYQERMETYDQAMRAFTSSPLIGIGPGSFGPMVASVALVMPKDGWKIVNNESIEILVENGLLGFAAITAFVVVLLVRSLKAFRKDRGSTAWYAHLGLFGASVGMLVQYQTFSTLYIMHVWVTIGLLVASQHMLLQGKR